MDLLFQILPLYLNLSQRNVLKNIDGVAQYRRNGDKHLILTIPVDNPRRKQVESIQENDCDTTVVRCTYL